MDRGGDVVDCLVVAGSRVSARAALSLLGDDNSVFWTSLEADCGTVASAELRRIRHVCYESEGRLIECEDSLTNLRERAWER